MILKRIKNEWNQSSTIKNITGVGIGDFLSQVFNVFTALFLIRGLTAFDYASFSAMNSVANLSSGVIGAGINLALVRFSVNYTSRTGKKATPLYTFVLVLEVSLFLVITLLSFLFPELTTLLILGEIDYQIPLQFGLLYGMGLLLTQIGRSIYQAEENFKGFVAILLLRQMVTLTVIGILYGLKQISYQNVAVAIAAIYIVVGLWIFYKCSGGTSIKQYIASFISGKPYFFSFLKASSWLIGYFFLISLIGQIDILTLSRFSTKNELATYSVALKYYSMALIFLGSINSVLLPKFSQVEMQDSLKQRAFSLRWIKICAWLIIPIIIFDLFGKPLFVFINGAQYTESFSVFLIFSFGIWISFILSPQTNIIIARGNFRFLFIISFLATIYCALGNILLVPSLGGIGAAIIAVSTYNFVIQVPILIKVLYRR